MNNTKTQTARCIIAFWHMIEFLTQDDFPKETREEREKAENAERGGERVGYFTRFLPIPVKNAKRKLTEGPAEDTRRFPQHLLTGDIHFCVGKIARESLIQALYSALKIEDDRPEADKSKICLLAFKTNADGIYVRKSLQVSPIAWGVYRCARSLDITREAYDAEMDSLGEALSEIEPLTQADAYAIFDKICESFLKPLSVSVDEVPEPRTGALIYSRYRSREAYDKYAETAKDYSALLNSFYLDDLDMVKNYIQNGKQDTPMLKSLIDYIVSGAADADESSRVNIRESVEDMENCLRAANSPMGKWPSMHAPALMQQIAVNMGVHNGEYHQPIFSVNGPPGTGKTTLLKEIIASNVVDRAKLLCEYEAPDAAFEEAYFKDGECVRENGYDYFYCHFYKFKNKALADYSMLVASCNNAAVENITKELPDSEKLLKDLQGDDLSEIAELFDVSRTEESEIYTEQGKTIEREDVYFSYPAQKLLGSGAAGGGSTQWGLISAPMGKTRNVRNYYYSVLKPILENQMHSNDIIDARKARYAQSRNDFLAQYKTVAALRTTLDEISRLPPDYRTRDAQYCSEIEVCRQQIARFEEELVKHAEKLRIAEKEQDKALARIQEAQTRLNECLASRGAREAELLAEKMKIKTNSDRLMELYL